MHETPACACEAPARLLLLLLLPHGVTSERRGIAARLQGRTCVEWRCGRATRGHSWGGQQRAAALRGLQGWPLGVPRIAGQIRWDRGAAGCAKEAEKADYDGAGLAATRALPRAAAATCDARPGGPRRCGAASRWRDGGGTTCRRHRCCYSLLRHQRLVRLHIHGLRLAIPLWPPAEGFAEVMRRVVGCAGGSRPGLDSCECS